MSQTMSDVAIVARVRTKDGREVSHNCSFAAAEWERLHRFVTYAKELTTTRLVSTKGALKFSLVSDVDGVRFQPEAMPEPDDVYALLHKLRPFVLNDEQTHFGRVTKILLRRLDHPDFRRYIKRQREIFAGERWQ